MKPLSASLLFGAVLGLVTAPVAWAERPALRSDKELMAAAPPLGAVPENHTVKKAAVIVPPKPTGDRSLVVATSLGDLGYANGFRLSNLGGRQEVFVPLPQGSEIGLSDLVLVIDDVSAHDARRSLEILVNDRSVASLALDGKSPGRVVHVPLAKIQPRDGFLKLSFVYSGAATLDRCIDVRYVGDSVTIRPDSAVELNIKRVDTLNITATATLMPHEVAILLANSRLSASDIAAALTLSRSLTAAGRRAVFYHGLRALPELVKRDDPRRWERGLIIVGSPPDIATRLDLAHGVRAAGTSLVAATIAGAPVLLVADAASARNGRLLGNPTLAALRDTPAASVRPVTAPRGPRDHVSFDELGLAPVQAEVFGRADMSLAVPMSLLPAGTHAQRLVLDVMVAPDGNDQKAVVSTFVNERLLASTVAEIGAPTRLDFPLPDGLVGINANIRVVVQRRSAQGDCRFEPQGYPAEILGSSAFMLTPAGPRAEDFSDLASLWADGVEILVPAWAADRPLPMLGVLSDVLSALTRETAPLTVKFIGSHSAPNPGAPFLAVSDVPPQGRGQPVRFDQGRIAVVDKAGRTRLDLGGVETGAVAQIVTSNRQPGLWIKPLGSDGALPLSPALYLDRGNVAFLDKTGVALAMSTERDTLLRIAYPEKGSWVLFFERFRSWIVAAFWAFATVTFLAVLQKIYRRRRAGEGGPSSEQ